MEGRLVGRVRGIGLDVEIGMGRLGRYEDVGTEEEEEETGGMVDSVLPGLGRLDLG
jgi:hypothetical protein